MGCQRASGEPLLVVGAGALGQTFAALLAHSGQPVLLVARPISAARLLEHGTICLRGVVEIDVAVSGPPATPGVVTLVSDASAAAPSTGAVFTTKGHQLASAAQAVFDAWRPAADAWVAGAQNGLAKDDILVEIFGPARVVGAVTILGAQRESDCVRVTSLGATYLGEFGGRRSERVERAAALLARARITTEVSAAIESVLWSKACHAAGVFGVSVLTRSSGRRMNGNPDLVRAYLALVREAATVAAACDVELGDFVDFPTRSYVERSEAEIVYELPTFIRQHPLPPGQQENYPSMTQDLLAGRDLEVEEVFGDLVRRAYLTGIEVPRLSLVLDLLRGLNGLQPSAASVEPTVVRT